MQIVIGLIRHMEHVICKGLKDKITSPIPKTPEVVAF